MVAITVVLAGVLVVYLQTLPTSGGNVETNLGLRIEKNSDGDWLISVTGGSQTATTVTMQVVDPNTGALVGTTLGGLTYNNALSAAAALNYIGGAAAGSAWGAFNNNNANTKIDAGDTIVLYNADIVTHLNGKNIAGMKVQFLKGDSIIGTIKEIPA
jgi:hypothetical protein